MMKKEKWVKLETIRGKYELSNLGRLRKYVAKYKYPILMKGCLGSQGYWTYHLVVKRELAHRIIAKTFIPNPYNLPLINHKDGNKLNNSIENLEWCTPKENIVHAAKTGLMKWVRGEESSKAKLNNRKVLDIYHSSEKTTILSKKYKIDQSVIFDIKSGNSWRHITGGINVMKPRKYLSKEIIMSIYNEKLPRGDVAKKYDVSKSHVTSIKNGTIHSKITNHIISQKLL